MANQHKWPSPAAWIGRLSGRVRAAFAKNDFDRELARAGLKFPQWLERRRSSTRQYVQCVRRYLPRVRSLDEAAPTIAAAEDFLLHRFDLLGSGVFVPDDPDRAPRGSYRPIDWYLDPVRKLRFPRGIPHEKWKLYEMRPGLADIKYPWELARSQHWVTLAQTYALTGDERFALEIVHELDDFMEANPVGIGVNWTCTMDVAIRAANWCMALSLLLDCSGIEAKAWRRAYEALFQHACFIRSNLENKHEVTSNHFLSNVVGLHFLAAEFADIDCGRQWNAWCRDALEVEINVQVHQEGTDFESSVPYHRLVTELFMASARLERLQDRSLSAAYVAKLSSMVEFILTVTRPDGLMPVIGDADDGRLHVFSHFGNWNRQDARHLIAPAALLLNRPDWLSQSGPAAIWEAAWWGYDPGEIEPSTEHWSPPPAKIYPAIGIAVARRGGDYLAVTNGVVGTCGFGNHKHNELLSFEYHWRGTPIVVDPGSYVYTCDPPARNLFRSTAYHNTATIDGMEQNEFNPEWLFRLFEKASPEHLAFIHDRDIVEYHGRHRGYERFDDPVTHERRFRFELSSGALAIADRFLGQGEHAVRWHFHLAPGIVAAAAGSGRVRLSTPAGELALEGDADLDVAIESGWYSPSYGVRVEALVVVFSGAIRIDEAHERRFTIGPPDAAAAAAPSDGAP